MVDPDAREPAREKHKPRTPSPPDDPTSRDGDLALRSAEWRSIQLRRFRLMYPGRRAPDWLTADIASPDKDGIVLTPTEQREVDQLKATAGTAPPKNLVGLALSGGGIRSATFCLGMLQGLHERKQLGLFDYLSTVSGGGFVGGWWSAWLSRQSLPNGQSRDTSLFPITERLEPERFPSRLLLEPTPDNSRSGRRKAKEMSKARAAAFGQSDGSRSAATGDAIHHLRLYANYLTPRKGLLSADLWRAVTVISRNITLTWLVFGMLLFSAMLFASIPFVLTETTASQFVCSAPQSLAEPVAMTAADTACLGMNHHVTSTHRQLVVERLKWTLLPALVLLGVMTLLTGGWLAYGAMAPVPTLLGLIAFGLGITKVVYNETWYWFLIASTALFVVLCLLGVPDVLRRPAILWRADAQPDRAVIRTRIANWHSVLLRLSVVMTLILLLVGFGHELVWYLFYIPSGPVAGAIRKAGGIGAALLAIVSTIYTGFSAAPSPRSNDAGPEARASSKLLITIAPPLALLLIGVLLAWMSHAVLHAYGAAPAVRLGPFAKSPIFVDGISWSLLSGAALAGVFGAVELWNDRVIDRDWVRLTGLAIAGVVGGAGLILLEPHTVQHLFATYAVDAQHAEIVGEALAVLVGSLLLLAWSLFVVRGANPRAQVLLALGMLSLMTIIVFNLHPQWFIDLTGRLLYIALAGGQVALASAIGLGWMTDPNLVALHTFYKSRLIRAYLGASNAARDRSEITETVGGDDILVSAMRNTERGAPYHLINTTLNLVGGRDLATSQRSSATFVIARHACGSARTGYRPTDQYMHGAMTLGTALATSGAAFSPNMGSKTPSAAAAMLLAMLNVRTGLWAPTPNKRRWREAQPRLWPYYLLRESLSQTNELSTYCYLSDGGHFDNTGVYSLIERGTRFIVMVDCGADPTPCFSDVGDLIRHCRIDFGAEITLDLEPFRHAPNGLATQHWVMGDIAYSPAHAALLGWDRKDDLRGKLLWIKPAILKTDPADVRQYRFENDVYPQQTTLDQWFDESQFESYRRLGVETARSAFRTVPEGSTDGPTAFSALV